MQRVKSSSAAPGLPTTRVHTDSPGYFTAGEPGVSAPTVPGADWFNDVQEEICDLIEHANGGGLTLSDSDRTQLRQAIETMIIARAPHLVSVPTSASASGTPGQIAYNATHIYVCVATDTWMRATLASW